jgi:hypothetical protein
MALLGLCLQLIASAGRSPTVDQCVAASTRAQEEQKSGAYLAARRTLSICTHEACPLVVQQDCTRWLAEVLAATPSVVVVARMDGVDQRLARVLLDGHVWLSELSGRPEELEPGPHELTVTVGTQTQARQLLVSVGEKNRPLVFEFTSPLPLREVKAVARPKGRPFPVLPTILTALAAGGVATFATLGLTGRANLEALVRSECAMSRTCPPSTVQDIQRRFIAADSALGLGVVSAFLAIWQWWAWSTATAMVFIDSNGVTSSWAFRW